MSAPTPPRLHRRRRLLGWSAPVVLVALLVGALLVGVAVGNHRARAAYDDGDPAAAAQAYTYQQRWTARIEPWKAWFNAGTAELGAGRPAPATEQLRGALARVPAGTTDADGVPDPATPECRVRTNLSLALEAVGDDAGTEDPGAADRYYTEAMETVGPCSSDGEPETGAEDPEEPRSPQDRTEQRQREKRDRATEAPPEPDQPESPEDGQPPQPDPPQPDPPQPDAPQDPRLEELLERNREAERQRSEQQQERGGGSGGGRNW